MRHSRLSVVAHGIVAAVVAAPCHRCDEVLAAPRHDLSSYDFERFVYDFGKKYGPEEWADREIIFLANLRKTLAHNEQYRKGGHSWWMDLNRFADLTLEEFSRQQLSRPGSWTDTGSKSEVLTFPKTLSPNPARVDWREKNVVTAVKDQGHCGSCWAFSAVESVESHHAIASGKLIELSPQALVNCVQNPLACGGAGGCRGATMELAFNLSMAQGLPLESDLPYARRAETCDVYKPAVNVGGYVKLPANDASALETAVARKGPVSAIVAAIPWQLYGGGIFAGCSAPLPSLGNELDHGVQVVGYGVDNGHNYWLVRNSWGKWGEQGYIRITRESDNTTFRDDSPREGVACKPYPKTQLVGGECGMLFDTSFPTGVRSATDAVVVV